MAHQPAARKPASKKSPGKTHVKSAKKKPAQPIGNPAANQQSPKHNAATQQSAKNSSSARELVAPRGDRRYVRRDEQKQFAESDDAGRSLAADRRQRAKRKIDSGQGDRGDR